MTSMLDRKDGQSLLDPEPSLYDQVARLNIFKGLAPAHLRTLTECARRTTFDPASLVFQEGDPANRFYAVLKGSVALMTANEDGAYVQVQTVGPGEDLGWSWLFPPYNWHFTARAIEPTEAIFFYGTRLRSKCDNDLEFGCEITKRVAMVLIENVRSLRKQLIKTAPSGH
jgi:CRP-like cAMP-binding protein